MKRIKGEFANLLIQILRKLKVSVIIGMQVDGTLKSKYSDSYYYDNTINGRTLTSDGQEYNIPTNQPFNIEIPFKHEN